jgi:hypothetical protein
MSQESLHRILPAQLNYATAAASITTHINCYSAVTAEPASLDRLLHQIFVQHTCVSAASFNSAAECSAQRHGMPTQSSRKVKSPQPLGHNMCPALSALTTTRLLAANLTTFISFNGWCCTQPVVRNMHTPLFKGLQLNHDRPREMPPALMHTLHQNFATAVQGTRRKPSISSCSTTRAVHCKFPSVPQTSTGHDSTNQHMTAQPEQKKI